MIPKPGIASVESMQNATLAAKPMTGAAAGSLLEASKDYVLINPFALHIVRPTLELEPFADATQR